VIVDGALVELWGNALPTRRCTSRKHRNLSGHAPSHMHDERTEDYRDMISAQTATGVRKKRKAFLRKWRLKCKAVAESLEEARPGIGSSPSLASTRRNGKRRGPSMPPLVHVNMPCRQ
jgi:hypothetical protein